MPNNIKSGFKTTGIFPFVDNSVDYTNLVQRYAVSTDAPTTCLEQNLSNVTLSAFSRIIFLSASSLIILIESCIDPSILEQLKKADDH